MTNQRRRSSVFWTCAIAALTGSLPALAGVNATSLEANASYERFVVRFDGATPERRDVSVRQRLLDAVGLASGVRIIQLRHLAVGADVIATDRKLDRDDAQRLMERIAANPHVDYVEPDAVRQPLMTPNDAGYVSQWSDYEAAAGINLPAAWDKATGKGIVVAVIDTGIAPHSDLSSNLVAGYDFVSDVFHSADGDGRDVDPDDPGDWSVAGQCGPGSPASNSSWHGTRVAGTIAAVANNRKGIAGVAFDSRIMPVRALGRCGGYTSDIADAIVWASGGTVPGVPANRNPAEVINLSIGGRGRCDATMQASIDAAVAKGTVVVVGAGNANADSTQFSPASCNNVIDVAAVGRSGARAGYSNHGKHVDVSAPGGDGADGLLSTTNLGARSQAAEGYGRKKGTSQAAALVSGTVALMQSLYVNTPDVVKAILKETARPLPSACASGCGAGIVDAARAVSLAVTPVLTVSDVAVSEGSAGTVSANFIVSLSQASPSPVTFKFATADDTAMAGSDYAARALTGRTIAAGLTSTQIGVNVNSDTTVEPNETFFLNLSNPIGATIADGQGIGTIRNDDGGPNLSVSDVSISEGNSGTKTMVFTVSLSQASTTPVTFKFATADGTATAASGDYVGRPSTSRSIAPGLTSTQIGVTINGDTTLEQDETLALNISNVSGAISVDSQGFGHILNDDQPTLTILNASGYEGDSGTTTYKFDVVLSGPSIYPVSFQFATADGTATAASGDYVARTLTSRTIAPGDSVDEIGVTINGDSLLEPNENFYVNISNVVGATPTNSQGAGLIQNDDGPTISMSNATVSEGDSGTRLAMFTITLSQSSSTDVVYNILTRDLSGAANKASPGTDYVATTLNGETIPAGQTSRTFSVPINGDTTVEENEVFEAFAIVVSGGHGGASGTGTILNDDGPTLSIGDVSITEGNSGTKNATFTISLSQPSASNVQFDVATANGTATTADSDYSARTSNFQVIAAGQTTKTFLVPIIGDTKLEPNETFFVNVTKPVAGGATLLDGQAIGTILNDD